MEVNMWIIKYIDKNNKEKTKKNLKFETSLEASDYILKYMPETDAWAHEITEKESDINDEPKKINICSLINKYVYCFSNKKNDYFCYGLIANMSGQFVYIQTKPYQNINDFAIYRVDKFKDLMTNSLIKIKENGTFVDKLSNYI